MATYPGATLMLLPENETQSRITPRLAILHSAGGEAELFGWWMNDQSRGLESHFWVGRKGEVVQYMDTEVRADANGEANGYAVSIETQSSSHASEAWDSAQVTAIVNLLAWLCDTHGIPRYLNQANPRIQPGKDRGIDYHVHWGAPGPWTPSRGKVCPGAERIRQIGREIIPRLQNTTYGEDFDMDEKRFLELLRGELHGTNFRIEVVEKQAAKRHDAVMTKLGDGRQWLASIAGKVHGSAAQARADAVKQDR